MNWTVYKGLHCTPPQLCYCLLLLHTHEPSPNSPSRRRLHSLRPHPHLRREAMAAAAAASSSLPRKSLTIAIEASKSYGVEFQHTMPARFVEDKIHEVPYESLKVNKGFSAKTNHKDLMKQALLRLGGIVGTEDGAIGVLTYGSYLEKDKQPAC